MEGSAFEFDRSTGEPSSGLPAAPTRSSLEMTRDGIPKQLFPRIRLAMALPTLALPAHIPLAPHVIIGTCDFSAAGSRACLAMGIAADAASAGAVTLLSAPVTLHVGDAPLQGAHASTLLFGREHADPQSSPVYLATLVDAQSGSPIVRRHCGIVSAFRERLFHFSAADFLCFPPRCAHRRSRSLHSTFSSMHPQPRALHMPSPAYWSHRQ
jgi:hypothetical protein